MHKFHLAVLTLVFLIIASCGNSLATEVIKTDKAITNSDSQDKSEVLPEDSNSQTKADSSNKSGQWIQEISYGGIEVDVIIDKPKSNNTDVIMLFHGTAGIDSKILSASELILGNSKRMLSDREILYVSVVYPEEDLLFGDNIKFGEAAVNWVKEKMPKELGVTMKKLFMIGHSQGGHMVTKLGRLFEVDGIISNAPGPLNLAERCKREIDGDIEISAPCQKLTETFGSVIDNPSEYIDRSLLSKIDGFKSRILFTQGLKDADIQLDFWPILKNKVAACTDCKKFEFVEFENGAHPALFTESNGIKVLKDFLDL